MKAKANAAAEHAGNESLMNRSMDGVVGDYATRFAFAMDRLTITWAAIT